MGMVPTLLLLLCLVADAKAFELPPFSWDTVPRFVHCGPDFKPPQPGKARLPLETIYEQMAQFPMATLEKFTLQTAEPVNVHEESKILRAAAEIRRHNTSTRIMFYHMAWQNFPQFDLYNETQAHAKDHWMVTWDNGTVPGYDDWTCKAVGKCHGGTYNQSNPDLRKAWVSGMASVRFIFTAFSVLTDLTK